MNDYFYGNVRHLSPPLSPGRRRVLRSVSLSFSVKNSKMYQLLELLESVKVYGNLERVRAVKDYLQVFGEEEFNEI